MSLLPELKNEIWHLEQSSLLTISRIKAGSKLTFGIVLIFLIGSVELLFNQKSVFIFQVAALHLMANVV